MPRLPGPGHRALRCLRPGADPLVRTSDRLEVLSWLAVLVAVLVAVPIALAVGTVTRADLSALAEQQAASRRQVTAVLLEDAAPGSDLAAGGRWVRAPAVWTGPAGAGEAGEVPAPVGARAGETVDIWVDRAGRLAPRPIDRSAVSTHAVVTGVVTFVVLTSVAISAHVFVGWLLWRHRARDWEIGWAAVEPRWAGRADH
jgi:hypothetical protein